MTGQPSALVFSTGYATNHGVLTAHSGQGVQILLDAHAHASLHDAARRSRVPYDTFEHNSPEALGVALQARKGDRVVVAVESMYSVLGDRAPLVRLVDVCDRHDAVGPARGRRAHGIGVAGQSRGLVSELGLTGARHLVVTATLAK